MTVDELKEKLREKGLPVSGKKAELEERLVGLSVLRCIYVILYMRCLFLDCRNPHPSLPTSFALPDENLILNNVHWS